MPDLRNIVMAAVTAAAVAACAPAAERAAMNAPVKSRTKLVVENNNWLDVAVYLVRGSARARLGTVNSMSKEQFTIPDAYVLGVSDIVVQADPIGSTITYVSPPIQVFPGARVNLSVSNNIRLSNFAVFSAATP
ncbi:MAG TPA: hypothetical protein VF021_04720 [Longimicrobiales bacterium]